MKIIATLNKYLSFQLIPLYIVSMLIPLTIYGRAVGAEIKWGTYLVLFMLARMLINNVNSSFAFVHPTTTIKAIRLFSAVAGISCLNLFFTGVDQPFYMSMYSMLPYVLIYFLYKECKRTPKAYEYLIAYSLVLLVLGFYRYFRQEAVLDVIGREQSSSNAFYFALMPLPCVLLIKKNWVKVLALALVATVCIMSLKRTALVVVSVIVFMMFYQSVKTNKKMFFLIVVALVLGIYKYGGMMVERIDTIMFRLESIKDDGGSGRSDIYHDFLTQDIHDIFSLPEFIIGKGYRAFSRTHNYNLETVHNDYLEFTYAYGIPGLIFMIWLLFRLVKNLKVLNNEDFSFKNAYWCFLFVFVVYSMTGGIFSFIFTSILLYVFIALAEYRIQYDTGY